MQNGATVGPCPLAHLPTSPVVIATAVGVDPGFAKTGIAGVGLVEVDDRRGYVSAGVRFVETERDRRQGVRAGMDDARRTREQYEAIAGAFDVLRPDVLGVEQYTVHTPRGVDELVRVARRLVQLAGDLGESPAAFVQRAADGRWARAWIESLGALASVLRDAEGMAGIGLGNAAKTIVVWGVTMGVAYARGVPVYVFTAGDLKRRLLGRPSGSKDQVGDALEALVTGLADACDPVAPSNRNHVHDASGHAILALEALAEWRYATTGRR